MTAIIISLNPYSNGIYSMRIQDNRVHRQNQKVLILILLEDTL